MSKPGPDPELDEDEILKFINGVYGPVAGTTDIAEHFDVTTEGITKYLKRLEDGGFVEYRKIGRAKVWWLTPDGERRVDPSHSDSQ